MRSSLATFLLLGTVPLVPGGHRLGWALVDQRDGELFVHDETLRAKPGAGPSFGADDDDDDDLDGDDLDGDDLDGDDLDGDDLDGDDAGDDYGDDLDGDDAGDDVGALTKGEQRKRRRLRKELARLNRKAGEDGHHGKRRKKAKAKMSDKSITGVGTILGTVGLSNTMTITPKSTFRLRRIIASGDTAAVLTTVFAGEIPIVIDPIDCATIAPTAFHQPTFQGKMIRAGVPITVNYTVGSTTTALRLTFKGRGRVQSC